MRQGLIALRLAWSSLRYRAAASLAALVAIMLGSALLIACGGLFESAIRLDAAPVRLAGTPIVVGGSAGFHLPDQESQTVPYQERAGVPADAVAKVAGIPGVAAAIPDVSFPAVVEGSTAPALSGHGWTSAALTPYVLRAGRSPDASGEVVLDTTFGFRPGMPVRIAVNGTTQRFIVSGVVSGGPAALFFSTADTQRFAPRVDLVGVRPTAGVQVRDLAERIRATLGPDLTVGTGSGRGAVEFVGVNASRLPLILLSSIFGGIVLVVMALVVSATISLTVRQRQRELALLRATAATPAQVRAMVVFETMIVAVLATGVGLALGRAVGRAVFSLSVDRGVIPATLTLRQGPIPTAAGVLLALAGAYVTARLAARAAADTRPIQALTEAAIPATQVNPIRRLLALVFGVGTVALAVTTPFLGPETATAIGGPAVLTGAIAVALIAPELIVRVVSRIHARGTIELALINVRARAVAYAAVLVPLTLATAIALGNVYSETTRSAAAVDGFVDQFDPDVVVASTVGGISAETLRTVHETPDVSSASALVTSRGWIEKPYDKRGSDPMRLLGIGGAELSTKVEAGSLRDLTGDTVAVPNDTGLSVGDQVTLRLGDGAQLNAKVIALLDSGSRYPSLILPASTLAAHVTSGLPTDLLIRVTDGADPDKVADAIRGQSDNVVIGDASMLSDEFAAALDVEGWINYLLATVAIAYAAIASVNTLAVLVLNRRGEFGVQRLTGATKVQVRRMLLTEAGAVAAVGLISGTAISLFTVLPIAVAVGSFLPSGPSLFFVAVVAAVLLIVWPVTALTARVATRPKPFDAIGTP